MSSQKLVQKHAERRQSVASAQSRRTPITTISVPKEMTPFLDFMLRQKELKELGVTSKRQLVMIMCNIILQRTKAMHMGKGRGRPSKAKHIDITVSKALCDEMDEVVDYPEMKALWQAYKTSLIGSGMRSLLEKYSPEYRRLISVFDVDIDDIRKVVEKEKRATRWAVPSQ